jgi:hypothetical protein
MSDYPYITKCEDYNREWMHPKRLRYYLHKEPTNEKWCVIDRKFDLADGGWYTRKADCINSFIKRHRKEGA